MAAGVPIKTMVAGISCGLVTGETDDDYIVLTDIQGLEDFFGDMDFKVGGTHEGITAIQMDIKIHGLTRPIIEEAIRRCVKQDFTSWITLWLRLSASEKDSVQVRSEDHTDHHRSG